MIVIRLFLAVCFYSAVTCEVENLGIIQQNFKGHERLHPLRDEPNICDGEGEESAKFVVEALRFLGMGMDYLEMSNETEIAVLVGVTGTGKSTVTQYVANATNTLRAVCEWEDQCKILDDSSTIGEINDPVSKTFVPNLVVDYDTMEIGSPYYDMPGWMDLRNESVEIANTFFVKKVLDHGTAVKIIILTTFATINGDDKPSFKILLTQFNTLVPNPEKFRKGLVLVVNKVPYPAPDSLLNTKTLGFLKSFQDKLEELESDVTMRARFNKTLDIFLEEHYVDGNVVPQRIGFMRSPRYDGSLSEDSKFEDDKVVLKNVIHNNTEYVPKVDTDFGFPLSDKALGVLEQAGGCLSDKIKATFLEISNLVEADFQNRYRKLAAGDEDTTTFTIKVRNLASANYSFINSTDQPPSYFVKELIRIGSTFSKDIFEDHQEDLTNSTYLLDQIYILKGEFEYRRQDWTSAFRGLELRLSGYVRNEVIRIVDEKISSGIANFKLPAISEIITQIGKFWDKTIENVEELYNTIDTMKNPQLQMCLLSESDFSVYCVDAITKYAIALSPISSDVLTHILDIAKTFLEFCRDANIEVVTQSSSWVLVLESINLEVVNHNDSKTCVNEAARSVSTSLHSFASLVIADFNTKLADLAIGKDIDRIEFNSSVIGLRSSRYDNCNNQPDILPVDCMQEIIRNIQLFGGSTAQVFIPEIEHAALFLQFCLVNVNIAQSYQISTWTDSLEKILETCVNNSKVQVAMILQIIRTKLEAFTETIQISMLNKIDALPDISLKYIALNETLVDVGYTKTNFSNVISNPLSTLSEYLYNAVDVYSRVSNDSLDSKDLDIALVHLVEGLGNLEWKGHLWVDVHVVKVEVPFQKELQFTNFLRIFYNDLTSFVVQSDGTGLFHNWWNEAVGLINLEIFNQLWTKCTNAGLEAVKPSIIGQGELWDLLSTSIVRMTRFKLLLDLTLSGVPPCPSSGSSETIFIGSYISLKKLLSCSNLSQTRNLAILTSGTVYIDTDIVGSGFSRSDNLNLTIVAPRYHIVGNSRLFDLSGMSGSNVISHDLISINENSMKAANGNPGGPAGNFYGIYLNIAGGILEYKLEGGRGANGLPGTNGTNGANGSAKSFSTGEYLRNDCEGIAGGNIRVKVYPNSCNTASTTCNANNNGYGKTVTIDGTKGTPGTPGGDGGDGGSGGPGGNWLQVNLSSPTAAVVNGTRGAGGIGGAGGSGGRGGSNGESLKVLIQFRGGCNNYCDQMSQTRVDGGVAASGSNGVRGSDGGSSPNRFIVPAQFSKFVTQIKARAEQQKDNEFVHLLLIEFLSKLGSHSHVPRHGKVN